MAQIFMKGAVAEIELTKDDEEGQVVATCIDHPGAWKVLERCAWTQTYDDWNDATEYATDHADNGRQK